MQLCSAATAGWKKCLAMVLLMLMLLLLPQLLLALWPTSRLMNGDGSNMSGLCPVLLVFVSALFEQQ